MKTFVCVNPADAPNLTHGKSYKGFMKTFDGIDYITIHYDDAEQCSAYLASRFIPASEKVRPDSMFKQGLDKVGTSITRFLRDNGISDRPIPTGHAALNELGAQEPSSIPMVLSDKGLTPLSEVQKELTASRERAVEQTRFMKFWRERDHMNIQEATKAYTEVMADAERKRPLSVIYRVGRAPAKQFTDCKPFYYGSDVRAAIDALAIAIDQNPNQEIYIGKFVNSSVDDAE